MYIFESITTNRSEKKNVYIVIVSHFILYITLQISFFDKLISAFPNAAQIPDDNIGRMPLHWACLSSASPSVLQRLVDVYPAACKHADKSHGRLPIHYLAMHANSISQIQILLEADRRTAKQKDKQSQTPIDLAQDSSNPIKLDIINLLQKRRLSAGFLPKRRTLRTPKEPKDAARNKQHTGPNPDWLSPLNVPSTMPPGPLDYGMAPPPSSSPQFGDHYAPPKSPGTLGTRSKSPGALGTRSKSPGALSRHSFPNRPPHHRPPPPPLVGHQYDMSRSAPDPHPMKAAANNTNPPPVDHIQGHHHHQRRHAPPPTDQYRGMPTSATPVDHFAHRASSSKPPPPSSYPGEQHHTHHGLKPPPPAQKLVEDMNTTISNLKQKMEGQNSSLEEKNVQLSNFDSQLGEMNSEEETLKKQLKMAEISAQQQRDLLRQKRDRVTFLREEIAKMEEELRQEEADMETIERNILIYQENASVTESKLQSNQDEQGNIVAVQQALEEERNTISRNMSNCESEIKSLEAIQNLALDDAL